MDWKMFYYLTENGFENTNVRILIIFAYFYNVFFKFNLDERNVIKPNF